MEMPSDDGHAVPSLYSLLSNHLILHEVCPLLPVSSILSLAATSKAFAYIIFEAPYVFKHLNLSRRTGVRPIIKFAALEERLQHAGADQLSADECDALPLRCILDFFRTKGVLKDVTTLILDGLCVPGVIFSDILCLDDFNVRLLSVRNVTSLSKDTVQKVLRYLIRPSRPAGMPKLRGIYMFSGKAAHQVTPESSPRAVSGVTGTIGAQLGALSLDQGPSAALTRKVRYSDDGWYDGKGEVIKPTYDLDWANLLLACAGIIAFDAVKCRHCPIRLDLPDHRKRHSPLIAAISLKGCEVCHSAPEGPAIPGKSPPEHLPLLSPPPLYCSTVRAAQMPATDGYPPPPLFARCQVCLIDRHCKGCNAWWCESCYTTPEPGANVLAGNTDIKVFLDLCVEKCLIGELYSGLGEGGMWG